MIISHRHRYLFVELPRTGSSAIHQELRALYDGTAILRKHATYEDFLRTATDDEKTYFVFSAVRNPMDDAVSKYFKVKAGRAAGVQPPKRVSGAVGRRQDRFLNRLVDTLMTRFVRRSDPDFATFFLRFYVLPYDTWASLSHHRFGYVMRFESIADEFAKVLPMMGLQPVRSLPLANPTAERRADFASYFTPRTHRRARRVFGPYMERWGYKFPAEWGVDGPTRGDRIEYRMYSFFASLYWRHVRPRV